MAGQLMSNVPFGGCEALISSLGTTEFASTLHAVANEIAGIDEIFGFRASVGAPPQRLVSHGCSSAEVRASRYSEEYYKYDPSFSLCFSPPGSVAERRIAADEIGQLSYRSECYDQPAFSEKLSFSTCHQQDHFILNFYRKRGRPAVPISLLRPLAHLALPALAKHCSLIGVHGLSATERVERRLSACYSRLTAREASVCAKTITGMTAEAISIDLQISISTVLTYRRRAYERYGLTNANQFLNRLL